MEPLDYPGDEKPKPNLRNDKQLAFLDSAVGNLVVGATVAGLGALTIAAGDSNTALGFLSFFTGLAFVLVGIFRLFREAFTKKKKSG